MTEQEKKAQELGKAAFENNAKRIPCLDKNLMQVIAENNGDWNGTCSSILKAWLKGWDLANLAAPY